MLYYLNSSIPKDVVIEAIQLTKDKMEALELKLPSCIDAAQGHFQELINNNHVAASILEEALQGPINQDDFIMLEKACNQLNCEYLNDLILCFDESKAPEPHKPSLRVDCLLVNFQKFRLNHNISSYDERFQPLQDDVHVLSRASIQL